jgi:hypothetical protein
MRETNNSTLFCVEIRAAPTGEEEEEEEEDGDISRNNTCEKTVAT